ncbi:prepilin peptidase [Kordiimonas lipolytica]|uniref:Prepilin peptidase n=1 Tax=Kordiimonas lipolytica TaxID=1662421 RepID=A0ABV8U6Y2_9PROT|nr:A24 family peptidase [Kordiimonas lipolytica]
MTEARWGSGVIIVPGLICLLPGLLFFQAAPPGLPSLLLFFNLWVLACYDLVSFRLPNLLTLTLFITGAMYVATSPGLFVWDHFIGAVVGLVFFPAVNAVYKLVRGRDGIGIGDAKLLAGIGMWLGWALLPPVLLVASIAGLLYGGGLAFATKQPIATSKIPFGPFLCLGAWVAWLYLP